MLHDLAQKLAKMRRTSNEFRFLDHGSIAAKDANVLKLGTTDIQLLPEELNGASVPLRVLH
jgi:hypothetical protein